MEKAKVYCLKNPTTNEVFYVGATIKSLKYRLDQHYWHLYEAEETDRRILNKRFSYLRSLYPLKANIELLEECDINIMHEREMYYIAKYRESNPNLTNITNGGIGGDVFTNNTVERKKEIGEKISKQLKGKSKPKNFAENMSIARTGAGNPRAGVSKYGRIVLLSSDNTIKHIFNAGYEINSYFGKKDSYGNLIKKLVKNSGKCKYGKEIVAFENVIIDNTKDIV